jgi:hypothetical protein
LVSENDFNRLGLDVNLEPSNVAFRSYSDDLIECKGTVQVNVKYRGKVMVGELFIVSNGHEPLLGRQWIRGFGIELRQSKLIKIPVLQFLSKLIRLVLLMM